MFFSWHTIIPQTHCIYPSFFVTVVYIRYFPYTTL